METEKIGEKLMSWVITAIAVSGAFTAQSQIRAGQVEAIEIEQLAEQEKLSAEATELQRRQKLNKVLAFNVVGQAGSGIKGEGTPQSIALESAEQAGLSENVISLSERLKAAQRKRQAANVKSAGRIQATSTLLKAGSQAAQTGG